MAVGGHDQHMTTDQLSAWTALLAQHLSADLGVPVDDAVDQHALLDMAREAAHAVDRPAAPITTYLVGLAVARAGGSADDVAKAAATVRQVAAQWDLGVR